MFKIKLFFITFALFIASSLSGLSCGEPGADFVTKLIAEEWAAEDVEVIAATITDVIIGVIPGATISGAKGLASSVLEDVIEETITDNNTWTYSNPQKMAGNTYKVIATSTLNIELPFFGNYDISVSFPLTIDIQLKDVIAWQIDVESFSAGGDGGISGIINKSAITDTSITLSWEQAINNSPSPLRYKVVYSEMDNINSIRDAELNGTVALNWSRDLTSLTVPDLINYKTYYFNVLVKDAMGNKAIYHTFSSEIYVLKKSNRILYGLMEASPFVWNNRLYYLLTDRESTSDVSRLQIVDFEEQIAISTFGHSLGLASVIIAEDELIIMGTRNWSDFGNDIVMLKTVDLKIFRDTQSVVRDEDRKIFNSSMTFDPDESRFVLAYEVDESGLTHFSVRFAVSSSLENFDTIDYVFSPDAYAACPTIRYVDDYYYLLYLVLENGSYITRIARSEDLTNWEVSEQPFLTPDILEGVNTSDVDMVTFNGETYIFYSTGDQHTWGYLTYAVYNGTEEELLKSFFDISVT